MKPGASSPQFFPRTFRAGILEAEKLDSHLVLIVGFTAQVRPNPPPHAMGEIPQPALLNHVNHDPCKADPDQHKRGCTRKQCNPSSATVCSCLRRRTLTGTSSRNLAPRSWAQHNYSSPAATQRPSLPVQGAGGFP